MPQIAEYRVAVGTRHGGSLITPTIQCRVPDSTMREQVEKDLHERFQAEWSSALRTGTMFDLELVAHIAGRGWAMFLSDEDNTASGACGRLAINADEIAWLQTAVVNLRPEHPSSPPSGEGGDDEGPGETT